MNFFGIKGKSIITIVVFCSLICILGFALDSCKNKNTENRNIIEDSKIYISSMSELQQKNLYTLAKVWGYVKYRHPLISQGNTNWDAELLAIIPKVFSAKTELDAGNIMAEWLRSYPIEVKNLYAAEQKEEILFETNNDWINDSELLGMNLTKYLSELSKIKVTNSENNYARFQDNIVSFAADDANMAMMDYEDAGIRLLALFRYWNIIEYFYPYKNIIEENWDEVLYKKIPEFALGKEQKSYALSIANLTTYIHDSHATINDYILRQHFGSYRPMINITSLDGKIVVTRAGKNSNLKPGDIILSINDISMKERLKDCHKYISVSNLKNYIYAFEPYMIMSKKSNAIFSVNRNGEYKIVPEICNYKNKYDSTTIKHNILRTGLLEKGEIGYLNLEELETKDVDYWMNKFLDTTKGIIIDLRIEAPPFVHYVLSEYLNHEPTEYAKYYGCSISKPGVFQHILTQKSGNGYLKEFLDSEVKSLEDVLFFNKAFNNGIVRTICKKVKKRAVYKGKVVVLIGGKTISAYETAAMALKASHNVTLIGSPSAGANGDRVKITLPGGVETYFSGLAVNQLDGEQVQRFGLFPDIEKRPTIKGIRERKDEVLEDAISFILRT